MPRKLLPATVAVTLLAAACGGQPVVIGARDVEGATFFTQIVDFEQDVGAGLSLSTDGDGNPHMTYLAFEGEAAEGEEAAAPAAGAPVLPAVKHAHLVENTWTRSAAAEALDGLQLEDDTALWVDAEGTHHIAWTEGGALFYTDDPEGGEEARPQPVSGGAADGISITADRAGNPWISFYLEGQVQVATRDGRRWTVEPVAPADPGTPRATAIRAAGADPLVAYGDGVSTMLARRDGGSWSTEAVPGAGGLGVAMALDADGNPHLAYYNGAGAVTHAHDVGQGWEISDVADAGTVPERGGAAIVLDAEGVHHVAWQDEAGIGYASNADGKFVTQEVPRSDGGATPALGIGPDEGVWLGWWDQEDTEVQLAIRSEEEPLLALPSPQPTLEGAAPTAECEPQGSEVQIAAPPGAFAEGFDTDCLAVPAGEPYTIAFDNQDEGQVHNVNVYTDESATESLLLPPLEGEITGPDSTTYEGDPIEEPDSYFFQCDYHAATMTGTFVVAEANN